MIEIKKGDELYYTIDDKALLAHCTGKTLIPADELERYETVLNAHGVSVDVKNKIEVVSVKTETKTELVNVIDDDIETYQDGDAE